MKLKAFTLLLGSALVAIAGCSTTSQTAKRANPATVENIAPVYVSKNVSSRYNSASTLTATTAGTIKPYIPDEELAKSNTSHVVKPYVPDDNGSAVIVQGRTPDSYQVKAGDTLYSIAFRYGKDYRVLAKENGIQSPYSISVGQTIYLNNAKAPIAVLDKQQAAKTPEVKKVSELQDGIYIVKAGDTAVSVARTHNLTLSQLVSLNSLKKPYSLYKGQKLYVNNNIKKNNGQSSQPKTVPVAGKTETVNTTETAKAVIDNQAPVKVVSGKSAKVAGISWMWPAKGSVIKGFSNDNKGIDIAGSRGQNVNASAEGQVVYSGNALRGYGNLVIINHNNEYLSAYAHNDVLLVKEGQKVKKGQVIARMGSTDADRVKLHFEIRYKGNSVNPRKYLP